MRTASRRRQADRVALSDRKLTEAAIELMLERGANGTTLQAIGKRSGYSRGLVTHRFGSKGGLFRHLIRHGAQAWRERLTEAVEGLSGIEAVCAAARALKQFIDESPRELRVMYMLVFLSIDPGAEYRANVAEVLDAQRADVVRWIREGQSSGEIGRQISAPRFAEQFIATTYGIIYQWLFDPRVSHERMCEQFVQDIRARLTASADLEAAPGRVRSNARRVNITR